MAKASLLLFPGPSERSGAFSGCGLRTEFAGKPYSRLTDFEQRAAAFLDHGTGLPVEAVGQFPDRLHLVEQIIRLAARQARHGAVDPAHRAIHGCKSIIG